LCANHCRIGPNIIFNGEERNHVTPSALPALLDHYFRKP
jgi:NADH:ubiquinone oxidoreductase subunit E